MSVSYDKDFKFAPALREALQTNGFAVVRNVLTPDEVNTGKEKFHKWYEANEQVKRLHRKVSTRGIFKHFGIGGTDFLWYTRTRRAVADVYRAAHGLAPGARMITSLDGACYVKPAPGKATQYGAQSEANCGVALG